MGRPRKNAKPEKRAYTRHARKICKTCGNEFPIESGFYLATNPLVSTDGKRLDICKECCIKLMKDEATGLYDIEKVKKTLQLIDRPFVQAVWEGAIREVETDRGENGVIKKEVGKCYMKTIGSLPPYNNATYSDSKFINDSKPENLISVTPASKLPKSIEECVDVYTATTCPSKFEITADIIDRWGTGYSRAMLERFEKKYNLLAKSYQLPTALHEESLRNYVRLRVREEEATANGSVEDAVKWASAAEKAAASGKLIPKAMTKDDLSGGVTSISEISKVVEEATDIIEVLPKFKYRPNDAPDFIIWCYINFARKLKGLPQVDYEEVYKFYDEKKAEHIAQYGDVYGIFAEDTTENNRSAVEQFIQLPRDYNTGGEQDGE